MKKLTAGVLVLASIAGCAPERAEPDPRLGVEEEAMKQCPRRERVRGVDVSYYQPNVDWRAARAAGVQFAFARVADGARFVDPAFGDHWAGMKAAGVLRGSYQFFRPAQDPAAQAAVFLAEIQARGGLGRGDLPPALDIEVTDDVPAATLRARAKVWLARVEAATGRTPIIYTSPGFWADLEGDEAFSRYTLWLAHWQTACPTLPGSWDRWRFWQDATDRTVAGIDAPVDTDWFDGTRAELEAFAGGAPQAIEPSPPPQRAVDPRRASPAKPAPKARKKRTAAPVPVDLRGLLAMLRI
jgi:lysozyme